MRQAMLMAALLVAAGAATAQRQGAEAQPPGRNLAAEIQAEYERDKADREAAEAGNPPPRLRRTYTAAELSGRVARKDFPDQWPPTSDKLPTGFGECLLKAKQLVDGARLGGFPAQHIIMTDVLWTAKLWLSDGVVLITCSQLDRAMVRTTAAYK